MRALWWLLPLTLLAATVSLAPELAVPVAQSAIEADCDCGDDCGCQDACSASGHCGCCSAHARALGVNVALSLPPCDARTLPGWVAAPREGDERDGHPMRTTPPPRG